MNLKTTIKTMFFLLTLAVTALSCSQANMPEEISEKKSETSVRSNKRTLLETDSLALVAIYNALDGENWHPHNHWLKKPARLWKGVVIKPINGEKRVTELRLGFMHLNGKLPKEIKELTALKALDMCYNSKLKGNIIEEVYELQNLVTIRLQFTGITGELSPSVGKLSQLDTLDLWTSKWILDAPTWDANPDVMTGTLPKEMGQLKNLRFLRLGRQHFNGELPAEMGDMEALNFCDISTCKFSGGIPASFGKLKNLETLYAAENNFTKPLPQELGEVEKLEEIYIYNNAITGEIPASIGNLKNLRRLSLENNRLTGQIPDLSQLTNLGIIYLQNNQLNGTIPTSIGSDKHPRLNIVDLSYNNLTGSVPSREHHIWYGGAWWTELIVKGNRLTGVVDETHLNFEEETRKRFLPQQEGYGFDNLK